MMPSERWCTSRRARVAAAFSSWQSIFTSMPLLSALAAPVHPLHLLHTCFSASRRLERHTHPPPMPPCLITVSESEPVSPDSFKRLLVVLFDRAPWRATCHYSERTDADDWAHHIIFLFNLVLTAVLCLRRGGAPRLSEHQHISFLTGLWRSLGDGPPLQLALWESCRRQHGGKSLQRWNDAVRDQDATLWPLHLHGQQPAGLQLSLLHSR